MKIDGMTVIVKTIFAFSAAVALAIVLGAFLTGMVIGFVEMVLQAGY